MLDLLAMFACIIAAIVSVYNAFRAWKAWRIVKEQTRQQIANTERFLALCRQNDELRERTWRRVDRWTEGRN
jgi:hypothetical protein